jgi:hypothetical protein
VGAMLREFLECFRILDDFSLRFEILSSIL